MNKHKDDSSFYCGEKRCRKTAWDTPEYMTDDDWSFCEQVIELLDKGTAEELYKILWDRENADKTKRFFNQCMGWPEGWVYCQDWEYWTRTGFAVLGYSESMNKVKKALAWHRGGM